MNFINSINSANFSITIVAGSEGMVNVTFKATTDEAKIFTKAKKLTKKDAVPMYPADVIAKIESLENGVAALTAILAA